MGANEPGEIDVLCVGHACWDFNFVVDRHPGEDEKAFASSLTTGGGGPAANAAVTVSRLGGVSAFAGYLGRDFGGDAHFEELKQEGVFIEGVLRGESPTPLSAVLIKPGGLRTIVNYNADLKHLDAETDLLERFRTKVILCDGHQPRVSYTLVERAKKLGIPAVLDAGSKTPGTETLYEMVDYLLAAEKFAQQMTGCQEPASALERLGAAAPYVAITLGADGLIWKSRKSSGAMPACEVEAIDTTGAGDVFHGAFALAVARNKDFLPALEYARAAAALSCTRIGARAAIPDAEDLNRFLETRERLPDGS